MACTWSERAAKQKSRRTMSYARDATSRDWLRDMTGPSGPRRTILPQESTSANEWICISKKEQTCCSDVASCSQTQVQTAEKSNSLLSATYPPTGSAWISASEAGLNSCDSE